MPAKTPTARALVGSIAGIGRWHPDQDTTDLRRDLRAVQLEEHIRRVVDEAPPLTPEQRDRLATLLLRPGPTKDAA